MATDYSNWNWGGLNSIDWSKFAVPSSTPAVPKAPTLEEILAQKYDVSLPTTAYTNAGTGGQYGYVNGLPVLKASEADKVINQFGGYVEGNQADRMDNAMGWDTGSLSGVLTSGAGVFGLRKNPIMVDQGENQIPSGRYNYTGDFTTAAKQLGIDPSQFKDVYGTRMRLVDSDSGDYTPEQYVTQSKEEQLYNAINNAAKDLYLVAGKTGTGSINAQGERPAFATDTSGNHAAVLYRKDGDALVPIPESVKYYDAEMELSPGGGLKGFFAGMAPIASLFAAATGNPEIAALIQGSNSVIQGNSVLDAAKAAAMTYGASQLGGEAGAATKGATDSAILGNIASGATTGATKAALTGGDIGSAALMGGVVGGVNAGIKDLPSLTGSDITSGLDTLNTNTIFDDGSSLVTDPTTGNAISGTDFEGNNFSVNGGVGTYDTTGAPLGGTPETNFGGNLANPNDVQNLLDTNAGLSSLNTNTTTYDDGSTLVTDPTTGDVISGTDAEGNDFTVNDGVGSYNNTGAPLGGTPETNFGGNLADPNDVQKLLDYNASVATDKTPTVKVPTSSTSTPSTSSTPSTPSTKTNPFDISGGIQNLTPGLTSANQDYQLTGLPHMATGSSTTPYSISDLGNKDSVYNPFATSSISHIKPGLTQANLRYDLLGLPGYLLGKKEGGSIPGHNPEFFSEGGLQHRYVKGQGDGTSDSIPAMLASGEFVIPADVVSGLGNGDNDAGAKVLDEFLKTIRQHKRRADVKKLPPDSKGPLGYLLEAKHKVRK